MGWFRMKWVEKLNTKFENRVKEWVKLFDEFGIGENLM